MLDPLGADYSAVLPIFRQYAPRGGKAASSLDSRPHIFWNLFDAGSNAPETFGFE